MQKEPLESAEPAVPEPASSDPHAEEGDLLDEPFAPVPPLSP